MKTIKMFAIAASILTASIASAQTPASTATPEVTKRQVMQHERIKEGEKSGQLTNKEARHLKMREAKIRHDKREAKADGVVTPQEKAKLNREQNHASRAIAHQKHDAQVK